MLQSTPIPQKDGISSLQDGSDAEGSHSFYYGDDRSKLFVFIFLVWFEEVIQKGGFGR